MNRLHLYLITLLSVLYTSLTSAACTTIMDIANSPNNIDSVCAVPYKKVVLEFNYVTQQLINHLGTLQYYPNASIRIGLPSQNEISVFMPNYVQETYFPKSGSTSVSPGFKHSIYYNNKWSFAFEGIADAASGSYYFGSQRWGGAVNGIVSYTFNSLFNLSVLLGLSRVSEAPGTGGDYFNSFNPDINLNFSPSNKITFYAEVFGQTKIDSVHGGGFNLDGGVLILIASNTMVNLSGGQPLYGYLDSFKHYVNVGISTML
jgi:hypothetical protein